MIGTASSGPMIGFYLLSRHFEYAADRVAVEVTGEAEAAIRALSNLYQHAGVAARSGRFQELLSTHPSLSHRVEAIARLGQSRVEREQHSLLKKRHDSRPVRPA